MTRGEMPPQAQISSEYVKKSLSIFDRHTRNRFRIKHQRCFSCCFEKRVEILVSPPTLFRLIVICRLSRWADVHALRPDAHSPNCAQRRRRRNWRRSTSVSDDSIWCVPPAANRAFLFACFHKHTSGVNRFFKSVFAVVRTHLTRIPSASSFFSILSTWHEPHLRLPFVHCLV